MQWISQRLQILSEGAAPAASSAARAQATRGLPFTRPATTVHFRATVKGRKAMSAFIVLFIAICLFAGIQLSVWALTLRWPSAVSMVSDNRTTAGSTDRLVLCHPCRAVLSYVGLPEGYGMYGPARFAIPPPPGRCPSRREDRKRNGCAVRAGCRRRRSHHPSGDPDGARKTSGITRAWTDRRDIGRFVRADELPQS